MQEFFADYGLWLLIALLVIIGLIFLLSGRSKNNGAPAEIEQTTDIGAEPADAPQTIAIEPVATDPVARTPVAPPTPALPVAAAPVAPAPVAPAQVEQAPSPVAAQDSAEDDLLRLKGVGPKLKAQLAVLGVTRFAQIASWTDSDIATIDTQLGAFKGRPVRDQWVDQAKYLASGDIAGFEAKYGKV